MVQRTPFPVLKRERELFFSIIDNYPFYTLIAVLIDGKSHRLYEVQKEVSQT